MKTKIERVPVSRKFGRIEIPAIVWISTAVIITFPVTGILNGAFPIFTFVFLAVPLVALLRNRDSSRIGIRAIRWSEFSKYTILDVAGSLALMAIFEPWSHTYQILLTEAISSTHPDTTFGWLIHFPGLVGWVGFVFYAGLVTLFAEELFFRGWLLKWLQSRMADVKAILLQAILFTLPQLIAAFLLPPTQGVLYAVVYAWLTTGLIGGWVASRTQSIWPSLASATLYNLIMCVLVT